MKISPLKSQLAIYVTAALESFTFKCTNLDRLSNLSGEVSLGKLVASAAIFV